jgi:hypothetical protein
VLGHKRGGPGDDGIDYISIVRHFARDCTLTELNIKKIDALIKWIGGDVASEKYMKKRMEKRGS